jgi:hypothetical protein
MAGPGSKLDLHARHKDEYVASREPALLTVKPARYLAVPGRGEPGGPAFTAAMAALYQVAFAVRMARKRAGRDYTVAKLEGLWWGNGKPGSFPNEPKSAWHWQLLIRVPEWIQPREIADAADALVKKGRSKDVLNVELISLSEGRSVQGLHIGPYDQERETIERLLAFAGAHALKVAGKHHEIYLSDPRRVAASKLRTLIRYPVA